MSKRYTSTVTVTWEGNMLDAENMEEYIKQLQQGFLEEFGINIYKGDIKDITFTRLSKMFKEELKK
jgi:hypothetical protein